MAEKIQSTERLALNVTEAAAALGVSRPVVYQLMRRDDFPSFTIGTRRLVSRAGLQSWIEKQAANRAEV